jgi:hypothetical protein
MLKNVQIITEIKFDIRKLLKCKTSIDLKVLQKINKFMLVLNWQIIICQTIWWVGGGCVGGCLYVMLVLWIACTNQKLTCNLEFL